VERHIGSGGVHGSIPLASILKCSRSIVKDTLPGEPHETHFGVAFYVVELYRKSAWNRVDADAKNRWLTAEEIHQKKSIDGRPVHPTLVYLIRRSEVIQPWQ